MWDNPRMLNLLANALYVLAALIVIGAGTYQLVRSPAFPLKVIRIDGELNKVERARIVEALQGRLQGTFFTSDLDLVRQRFETVPWVRRAVVRRAWPDRLEVRLEEHVELARWGRREDDRLVNAQGELFTAHSESDLPVFSGPQGTVKDVARAYADFAKMLAPLRLQPRQVILSERRAWQLKLDSGLVLQLGRDLPKDGVLERLSRFVDVYPRALGQMNRRLDYVDLRYPNGFVLRVPGLQRAEEAKSDIKSPRPKA
jgi:cell division protein FtsQ